MRNAAYPAYHVFLSYSFKDTYPVSRLRDALQHHGLRVWPDRILTPGTDHWRAHVETIIAQSACVVAVLSRHTLFSVWVPLALEHARTYAVPVIPAIISGEPGHILLVQLDGSMWFDLRRSSSYRAEVAGLASLVKVFASQRVAEMA